VRRILLGRAVSPDAAEAGALERVVICGNKNLAAQIKYTKSVEQHQLQRNVISV
jgi:hypothetical protein